MKLITQLAILQQSEYNLERFWRWHQNHLQQNLLIEPETWTLKLKIIRTIVKCLFFLPLFWRFKVALTLTQPGEHIIREITYRRAEQKLKKLRQNGLVVVAIAGSYGKTSTKHILAHTLTPSVSTLMTPKSINTMLGISHVILDELQPKNKVFICELGEFNPGDLHQLTAFLKPDFAILTPIGHQHLELLGSFEKVVAEFTDFAKYFADAPHQLLMAHSNQTWLQNPNITTYGTDKNSNFQIHSAHVSRAGTEYQVIAHTQLSSAVTLKVFTPLFGEHQALNSLPTFWLAEKLQIPAQKIVQALANMPYIDRRHSPTFAAQNILILDNSYNTNPDSVTESIKLLNQLEPTNRLMITTGFVEQADEAEKNHEHFGFQLASSVDYLGLWNAKYASAITKGFLAGGGSENRIIVGQSQAELVQKMQGFLIPGSVLVFEGGYQELYS